MKKIVLIFGVACLFIVTLITIWLMTKKETVTISFDTDGGKAVSEIRIKEGTSIKLPDTEKEGYTFEGWFLKEEKVTDTKTFDKDVTLKAKWTMKEQTFMVTFDSDGGSQVSSIKVVCGEELSLKGIPTKEGYRFVSWVDQNETPILDGALLSCEDLVLKANWEKE